MNIATYPKYDSYKGDIAPWLGDVPTDWPFEKAKWFLSHRKQLNIEGRIDNVLSLTLRGVVNNDPNNPEGLVPKDYRTYQIFEADDLVFKLIDLENIRTSRVGLVHEQGIMSSAYIRIVPSCEWNARFLHYYYFHLYEAEVFNKIGSGVRSTLGQSDLLELPIPVIARDTQDKIVRLLDEKCAKIDEAVRIKEAQIKLLAERRQILIQEAVTRGLKPAAPMKDSGIDWIGQIPAHWDVKRFKYLFEQSRLPVRPDDEVVTSFRDGQVTLRSNRRLDGYTEAIIEGGYQGIRVGQLVLNSMDAFEGAIGVSESDGKCTPEYVICDPVLDGLSQNYFAYLLREMALARYIQVICNAVRQRAVRIRFNNLAHRFMVVPPTEEQEQIVEFVERTKDRIGSAVSIKQDQITALKEYKTSLINAAVTGKIKVI
ncbi:restriction endonuclease subunit S [Marivita sp.]|uniref:restriction endonuclease subunit S n=1 Tax=Marivita sp. TaxID=2003365 RepID=UPI0026345113|nr:restriction endonuclease subunit S [Marivita sp.]